MNQMSGDWALSNDFIMYVITRDKCADKIPRVCLEFYIHLKANAQTVRTGSVNTQFLHPVTTNCKQVLGISPN